jgi:ribosomal protein L29
LTHEGVEQKTSEELRRERDELLKQELDMMDFQLAKKRDDLPSLDWWLEPARAETVKQKTSEELRRELDESLKQLAARFEDIAPEEDKKPLLFLVEPTVTERKKYTDPLESDLRSYADLGDDWDDLPDTQGEIKLWIPEDLGQPKEISISKESLSSIDGIA